MENIDFEYNKLNDPDDIKEDILILEKNGFDKVIELLNIIKDKRKEKLKKLSDLNNIKNNILFKNKNIFETLKITLKTFNVVINSNIDISSLFSKTELVNYIPEKKKKGRRKKNEIKEEKVLSLKNFDIVFIKYKDKCRGNDIKNRKNKRCTPNQTCLWLYFETKFIHLKIFSNGDIHITGCNDDKKLESILENIFFIMLKYEVVKDKPKILEKETFMINIIFTIPFKINRDNLKNIINTESKDFYSSFDSVLNTQVNIKRECKTLPKNKKNMYKTVTFMVFNSGKVLYSGPDINIMKEYFYDFINFIYKFMEHIID